VVLLAVGLVRVFTAGGQRNGETRFAPEAVSSLVAIVEPSTTASPTVSATSVPAPTDTAAPSPTIPATASPTVLPASPTAAITPTPEVPVLPYTLRLEPMTAAARTAFLARASAANCADCYNVDLIGPEPYVELRLKIDDVDPPGLRTYPVPSLAFVAPRTTPHTLQAFDLQGNPASTPMSVEVTPDSYYVLRIVAR
jgi:hypothetical protein